MNPDRHLYRFDVRLDLKRVPPGARGSVTDYQMGPETLSIRMTMDWSTGIGACELRSQIGLKEEFLQQLRREFQRHWDRIRPSLGARVGPGVCVEEGSRG